MRIGLVIYGSLDTVSGGYLYDRKLVEYLRARGDTVEVISLPWRNYVAHLADNLTFRLPSHLDIIIQDELNHPSLMVANAGKRSYPVISLVHHLRCSEPRPRWQNAFYRFIEKKYLQSADGLIFNSHTTKNAVNGSLVNGKPFVVAYPPTDRFGEGISDEQIQERARRESFRILFLGNVIRRKGLSVLLKALKDTNYRLDIVGSLNVEPKYVREIQRQTSAYGLSRALVFHGALGNEHLIRLLEQSHLLVVPSLYEGFGIVYLEGMALGLPAIGTTAGAASEIIEDGKTGYLVAPDDAQMLTERINALANDRALLSELSINATRRYKSQPKWEQTANRIREFLYEQLRG